MREPEFARCPDCDYQWAAGGQPQHDDECPALKEGPSISNGTCRCRVCHSEWKVGQVPKHSTGCRHFVEETRNSHCEDCDFVWPVGGRPQHEEECPALTKGPSIVVTVRPGLGPGTFRCRVCHGEWEGNEPSNHFEGCIHFVEKGHAPFEDEPPAQQEPSTQFPDGLPAGHEGCEGCGEMWATGRGPIHKEGCPGVPNQYSPDLVTAEEVAEMEHINLGPARKESGTLFPTGIRDGHRGCENCGWLWPHPGEEKHDPSCEKSLLREADEIEQTLSKLADHILGEDPAPPGEPVERPLCAECGFTWPPGSPAKHARHCRLGAMTEIRVRFTYHPPSADQIPVYEALRKWALSYAQLIIENVPNCRERSLALTKLEECVMHANSGVARRS